MAGNKGLTGWQDGDGLRDVCLTCCFAIIIAVTNIGMKISLLESVDND